MMKLTTTLAVSLLLTTPLTGAWAQSNNPMYEVTITNVTRDSLFTPILVVSHRPGVELFTLGEPASEELAILAEGGDIIPLEQMLLGNSNVVGASHSDGLLPAGESVTVEVPAGNANRISLAAMILPTNDGFIALNSVEIPRSGSQTFTVNGYDAGSEPNDESCANIPGPLPATPECEGDGEGVSPNVNGEGFVHVHAGTHGIGDVDAATYDWRNPMAVVTVRKVR